MTSGKRSKSQRAAVVKYTHEPKVPQNWPEGHVSVELTGDDLDECIAVTIRSVRHYLHSTTARELEKMLSVNLMEWNKVAIANGFDPV